MTHSLRKLCATIFLCILFTRLLNPNYIQDVVDNIHKQAWETLAQALIDKNFVSLIPEKNVDQIIQRLLKLCSMAHAGWVIDSRTNEVVYQSKDLRCYAVSHDQKLVVHYQPGYGTGALVFLNTETKKKVIVPYPHEKFPPYDCAFTHDNRYLIITICCQDYSPEIVLYDLEAQQYCTENDNELSRILSRINNYFSKMYRENHVNKKLKIQLLSVATSPGGNYLAFVITEPVGSNSNIEATMYIYDVNKRGLFKASCAIKKLIEEQQQLNDKFYYKSLGKPKFMFSNDDRFLAWHNHYKVEPRDHSIRKIAIKAICEPSSGIFTLIEIGETKEISVEPLLSNETGTDFIDPHQNNQYLRVQKLIEKNFSFEATLFLLMLDKWYQERHNVDLSKKAGLEQLFTELFVPKAREFLCKEYKIKKAKHSNCVSF